MKHLVELHTHKIFQTIRIQTITSEEENKIILEYWNAYARFWMWTKNIH